MPSSILANDPLELAVGLDPDDIIDPVETSSSHKMFDQGITIRLEDFTITISNKRKRSLINQPNKNST